MILVLLIEASGKGPFVTDGFGEQTTGSVERVGGISSSHTDGTRGAALSTTIGTALTILATLSCGAHYPAIPAVCRIAGQVYAYLSAAG